MTSINKKLKVHHIHFSGERPLKKISCFNWLDGTAWSPSPTGFNGQSARLYERVVGSDRIKSL